MTEIKVIVRNVAKVQSFLKSLPRGTIRVGLRAFAEYILGDESHGLRHYEPYKHIKPFRSYSPDPEKAARQRRWIFANLDKIGTGVRSGGTAAAWTIKETNGGYGQTLSNPSEGAKWLWGDATQTRHQRAVGHRNVSSKVASNIMGALRHARAEIGRHIKAQKG